MAEEEFPTWDEVCSISGTSATGQAYGIYLLARELHEFNRLYYASQRVHEHGNRFEDAYDGKHSE